MKNPINTSYYKIQHLDDRWHQEITASLQYKYATPIAFPHVLCVCLRLRQSSTTKFVRCLLSIVFLSAVFSGCFGFYLFLWIEMADVKSLEHPTLKVSRQKLLIKGKLLFNYCLYFIKWNLDRHFVFATGQNGIGNNIAVI